MEMSKNLIKKANFEKFRKIATMNILKVQLPPPEQLSHLKPRDEHVCYQKGAKMSLI